MLLDLFTWLTKTVSSSSAIAVLAAFIWGIISILLSPCHLASIPLIIGFITGRRVRSAGMAFRLSLLYSLGILVTIAVLGFSTGLLGRIIGDIGPYGNIIMGAILVLTGMSLLDILPVPSLSACAKPPAYDEKGHATVFILGLAVGAALGPCTFAYMAPVLAVVFSCSANDIIFGTILVAAFAVGHCSVLILAGMSADAVQRYLKWDERSRGTLILRKACGVIVILGGIYFMTGGLLR